MQPDDSEIAHLRARLAVVAAERDEALRERDRARNERDEAVSLRLQFERESERAMGALAIAATWWSRMRDRVDTLELELAHAIGERQAARGAG